MRWVHQYAPEIEHKIRPHLKPVNDSWRCDETYIKGKVIGLIFIELWIRQAKPLILVERFFKKVLSSDHVQPPRVITVDKSPSYPAAIENLKKNKKLPQEINMRQTKYLNNIIEQDHRFIRNGSENEKTPDEHCLFL